MKKKFSFLFIGVAMLFFAGCGDTVVDYADGKAKAQIIFLVSSTTNSDGIDSVKITLIDRGNNREIYSDTNGRAVFGGLTVGSYRFAIEKEGYEPMWYNGVIQASQTEVPLVFDLTVPVDIRRQSVGISGVVKYTDKDGKVLDAADATVDLELDPPGGNLTWQNPFRTATTDASGAYSITGLPDMTDMDITSRKVTVDSITYSTGTTRTITGKMSGETDIADPLNMTVLAQALDVETTNLDKIGLTDGVEIIFSQPVDQSDIRPTHIQVMFGGEDVIVTTSWSSDGRTLTLTPFQGKWWGIGTHALAINGLVSDKGMALNGGFAVNLNFDVFAGGSLGNVTGLEFTAMGNDTNVVDYNTGSVVLTWQNLTNAVSYEIYVKASTDSAFHKVDQSTDSTETLDVSPLGTSYFEKGGSVEIMVLGLNTENRSDAATATTLTLTDGFRPTASNNLFGGTWSINAFDNSGNADEQEVGDFRIDYSEPMDTSGTSISLVDPSATNLIYTHEWESLTRARIRAFVPADGDNNTETPADLVLNYSNMEDIYGNTVISDPDTVTVTVN